ncbi:MAG TPA: triose-phosphate isomerase family protein [Candidatus Saccharimonadales bacterium]|nr:triose-phosphate isomerase family protein [Candidatus Saccharimonadales bacterium]
MKKLFIIGNWKSYKTSVETKEWFEEFSKNSVAMNIENKEAILCVPFTVLSLAKSLVDQYNLPLELGAQDLSPFDEGKYTGEVTGEQIAEFAKYVIIGHSERRQYFLENEEMVNKKIEMAFQYGLTPVICISEIGQVDSFKPIIEGRSAIIAYEPLFAIGSGKPDSPENAEKTSAEIQEKMENISIIYGGSVTSQNVHSFTAMQTIAGVLPGGASLNAAEFTTIIANA